MASSSQVAARYQSCKPIFGVVAPGMIRDVFLQMAKENEQRLNELGDEAGCFKETPQIVEFVFLLSEKWSLTESARYQAIEIFERFMFALLEEFSNSSRAQEDSSRIALQKQIQETYLLRLVSCVQLASKLAFHYSIVNNNLVLKFLQSLGFSYTTVELLESELAVLKALQFQINVPTPLAYVEMLLEVLGHNGSLSPTKQLHEMCCHLLSLTYLLRSSIYNTLLKASIENPSPSELQLAKFVTVKEDLMLLAVGIIGAGFFLLKAKEWNQVVENLSATTGISVQSAVEMAYAILTHSLGHAVETS